MSSLSGRFRVGYLFERAARLNISTVWKRAQRVAKQFDRSSIVILSDMFFQAAFRQVGFQDYVDYDFAILTDAERRTMMTHPLSDQISQTYDHPDYRHLFHDKWEFVQVFDAYMGREWMLIDADNARDLEAFAQRNPVLVTKLQGGVAGASIKRYFASEITDWDRFHSELLAREELLVEANIDQHADLAAYCPGTVNSTRVVAFFDGTETHILAMAQKFGRGQVADQMDFGGFYTMLDDGGKALGAGYDSYGRVHEVHPESGLRIADFQLPLVDEVLALVDTLARVVPQVQYVGWDIAVTPTGPVVIEGNWGTGVYEVKPSVLGIRTGHRPRYLKAIGQ